MNYDAIIVELLSRIQVLEEKVARLEKDSNIEYGKKGDDEMSAISTSDVREYIISLKNDAVQRGEKFIVLIARDIHKALHFTGNRYPIVCHAMYQTMRDNDEELYAPPSKQSSKVTIKYYL